MSYRFGYCRVHNISIQTCRLLRRQQLLCVGKSNIRSINNNSSDRLCNEKDSIEDKVVYNCKIKHSRFDHKRMERILLGEQMYMQYKNEGAPVLALKYVLGNSNCEEVKVAEHADEKMDASFPYEKHHDVCIINSSDKEASNKENDSNTTLSSEVKFENGGPYETAVKTSSKPVKSVKAWMKDYNKYTEVFVKEDSEEDKEGNEESEGNKTFLSLEPGTADPNVPSSSVPCGGCGANLHCQDAAIPGFLPKELFVGLKKQQLRAVVCQRCHFLREYNTALSVNVDPKTYPQLLSQIKDKVALVILVIDMTDFPCSIWPGILNVIGPKRPLVVVGNKIDLLQDLGDDWLERAKEALIKQLPPKANLLHVSLVSAKTGYGIESLITSLQKLWEYRGDVYLVGCTNVGKSTLFNILLQSDYCKSKATDLLQKATTAPWPGTTLNLLKFPIMRPNDWRMAVRTCRLREGPEQEEGNIPPMTITPQKISKVIRTFNHGNTDRISDDYWNDPFAMPKMSTLKSLKAAGSGLDPDDPVFAQSHWLYDTPGVITSDQIIDLLTTEELLRTLPQEPIIPRTFQLWAGQSLLLAGLGRIDYIDGPNNIKLTVLSSFQLPVTVCFIEHTEEVYHHYLGSEVLWVPCGGPTRLQRWPGLQAAPEFVLKGDGWRESCADVVLSSAGVVAVTAMKDTLCRLQAWTPNARGIHVRVPPVLPRAIALKGCKMFRSPAYALIHRDKKHLFAQN